MEPVERWALDVPDHEDLIDGPPTQPQPLAAHPPLAGSRDAGPDWREQIKEPITILRSTAGMLQLHGRGGPSRLETDRQALERAVVGLTKAIRQLRALRATGVCVTRLDQPDRPNTSSYGISAANQVRSQLAPRQ